MKRTTLTSSILGTHDRDSFVEHSSMGTTSSSLRDARQCYGDFRDGCASIVC